MSKKLKNFQLRLKKTLLRSLSFLLTLIMLFSLIPFAYADDPMTVDEIMKKFGSAVQRPRASSVLDEPEELEVWTTYGRVIYVHAKPSENSKKLSEAKEGAIVTVYADLEATRVLTQIYIEETPEPNCRWEAVIYHLEGEPNISLESVPKK